MFFSNFCVSLTGFAEDIKNNNIIFVNTYTSIKNKHLPSIWFYLIICLTWFFCLFFTSIQASSLEVKDSVVAPQGLYGDIYNKKEERFREIKSIIDPDQKAVEWLIFYKKIIDFSPNFATYYMGKANKLWNDSYPNKGAILLISKAEIDIHNGKYQEAKKKVLNGLTILKSNASKSTNNKKLFCIVNNIIGRFSKYTKEEESGLSYCYTALELAEEIDFNFGKVLAYNQLGLLLFYGQEETQLALNNFLKAQEFCSTIKDPKFTHLKPFVLMNIARMSAELGDLSKSVNALENILELESVKENSSFYSIVARYLGKNHVLLGNYDIAKKYLENSITSSDTSIVNYDKGASLYWLANLHLKKGEVKKAIDYTKKIDKWLERFSFNGNGKTIFYQLKSEIAKTQNDQEKVIYWMQLAAIEKDSFDRKINTQKLIQIENKYKFKQIEREKAFLENEQKLSQKIIKSKNIQIIGFSIIIILAFLFSSVVYQQRKEIEKNYDHIIATNESLLAPIKPIEESSEESPNVDLLLKEKIIHALQEEKLYLLDDLTLKKFADQLASNTSYISKTINDGFGKNFSSLINEYRIKEILKLFKEGQHQIYTIETLSQKSGFKSKSSFQKAFKKYTGVTASYYLDQLS